MPATTFEVFVFDFDGTLVQSADAKRQAFFDVFPPECAPAVVAVLTRDPDASRHVVIPMMLAEIEQRRLPIPDTNAQALIAAYGAKADASVAAAPEMPGAGTLLQSLSDLASVYIASMTPQAPLDAQVTRRGWRRYVAEAFGYPTRKVDAVAMLLARHRCSPGKLLVVGDGVSDAEAAAANGCRFHKISGPADLLMAATAGMVANV